MPEVVHVSYNEKGHEFQPSIIDTEYADVFVLENLLESGFENYENGTSNDDSHMRAVLECLSQLHGTGIAYKLFSVSAETNIDSQKSNELDIDMEKRQINKLKEEFPVLEEQIQLKGSNIYIIILFGGTHINRRLEHDKF